MYYPDKRRTDEEVREALIKARGIISNAARLLDLRSVGSLRTRIMDNPDLKQVLEEAREETKDLAEWNLIQAIKDGQQWAILFYLKTQARDRNYSDTRDINLNAVHKIDAELDWGDPEIGEIIDEDKDSSEEAAS